VSRISALVAVVLVVIEAATAVVVNLATDGRSAWLWPLLAVLVIATCALVWWQQRRGGGPGTRIRLRAGTGGEVADVPVDVAGAGGNGTDVSVRASWWGRIRRSGVTVRR
jgi:hypothetical protein